MKRLAGLLGAVSLCGCGITGKLDAVSNMELSGASYRVCLAQYKGDAAMCKDQRTTYRTDLAQAQKTRGVLTDWRRL